MFVDRRQLSLEMVYPVINCVASRLPDIDPLALPVDYPGYDCGENQEVLERPTVQECLCLGGHGLGAEHPPKRRPREVYPRERRPEKAGQERGFHGC